MTASGRPATPLVSATVITNRSDDLLETAVRSVVDQGYRPLELVLFGNGAPVHPPRLAEEASVPVRVGAAEGDLGVAAGRNAAARLATGELLLFLDDDAVLQPGSVRKAVEVFASSATVGAVAFRVTDPDTKLPAVWYYPHDPDIWSGRAFDAPSLVGGGNMIRRECFERLGGFWEGYFRDVEEIDLSWRLIDAGWRIRYEPRAAIEHPERSERHLRHSVASNLLMVWRLLPPGLALRQTALKLPLFAARSLRHGEVGEFVRGLRDALAALPRLIRERSPLAPATVRYLRRAYAPQGLGKRLQWSLRPISPAPPADQAVDPEGREEAP